MNEFHRTIEIDRTNLYGHWNLAAVLADERRFDEALVEYHAALGCTQAKRDLALLHIHIGDALKAKAKASAEGNLDKAITEYRRAAEIDPSYAWTRISLAEVLRDQGKIEEAITEYRAVLQSSHTDDEIKAAQEGLDKAKAIQAKKEAIQTREKTKEKAKQAGAHKDKALPPAVQDAQAEMR